MRLPGINKEFPDDAVVIRDAGSRQVKEVRSRSGNILWRQAQSNMAKATVTDGQSSGSAARKTPRAALVAEAIKTWVRELIELGGRNRLLYYRPLKTGTLDLASADTAALDRMLLGRTVRVSELYPEPEAQQDAVRRCRAIAAKARENDEERGIRTLYLASGMATWQTQRSSVTPNAPVILQPITLTSIGYAGSDFALSLDDEQELNPTLLHLLATDYGISFQGVDLLEPPPKSKAERFSVAQRLAKRCEDLPSFGVSDAALVGNFSYAKLPMVRDIEQHAQEIEQDMLLAALAGDDQAREGLRNAQSAVDFENLVPVPPPKDEFIVLDADLSQSWAIAAAVAGATLVIEGPPGTGKSQTIANLIATLVARGKSVLFVAEKRAAIDAVVHRLHDCDLGSLVLDLHGGTADRRKVAKDIQAALRIAAEALEPDVAAVQRRLTQRRNELEQYREQLHAIIQPWGTSAFECQARLLGIDPELDLGIRFNRITLESLSGEAIEEALSDLRRFVELGGMEAIDPDSWPLSEVFEARVLTGPVQVERALEAIEQASHEDLPKLAEAVASVVQGLGLNEPTTIAGTGEMTTLLEDVAQLVTRAEAGIYDFDLAALERALSPARSLFRVLAVLFRGTYRRARTSVREVAKAEQLPDAALLDLVEDAQAVARRWNRATSVPGNPQMWAAWAEAPALRQSVERASAALGELSEALGLGLDDHTVVREAQALAQELHSRRTSLMRFPELHRLHASLVRLGLSQVIDAARAMDLDYEDAALALERTWLASVLSRITLDQPRLANFDRQVQDTAVNEYVAADKRHIASAPARVKRAWASHSVSARDGNPHQSDILSRQASLQRRHMPIRDLYDATASVLIAVKPCWVMSPLVVAQVLPARKCFDVVIFDEASQIPPADAVSSLMRAKQAIVAGDPHQLPPTTFFASATPQDEDDDDQEHEGEPVEDDAFEAAVAAGQAVSLVGDQESLLDQMQALLPPPYGTRTLSWHYRSRCERLISFSNAREDLYDWALTTFPSAIEGPCIDHVVAGFTPGAEEATSSASHEVHEVVRLILEHAAERTHQSLGVIALGVRHANRILEELKQQLSLRDDLEGFFSEEGEEPFFVKNLERVQGDERDAIILTTGYSKTKDGRMRYNFGPINQSGGHRRLNVAVTRAKYRMTLVSSFRAGDMDDEKLTSPGARMLRDYLLYAESGGTNLGVRTRRKPDMNPFERDVYQALSDIGIPLVPQYGESGRWIDFAAMHRNRPGEPVLAIETDGAMYHSSQSARDSDRLRQASLERLGWRFHRIWSTEWFRHKEREIELALIAYEDALKFKDHGVVDHSEVPPARRRPDPSTGGPKPLGRETPPRVPRGLPITSYSAGELRDVVRWVSSDGKLRTTDEVVREAMAFLGFAKRGSRIVRALTAAIDSEAG